MSTHKFAMSSKELNRMSKIELLKSIVNYPGRKERTLKPMENITEDKLRRNMEILIDAGRQFITGERK